MSITTLLETFIPTFCFIRLAIFDTRYGIGIDCFKSVFTFDKTASSVICPNGAIVFLSTVLTTLRVISNIGNGINVTTISVKTGHTTTYGEIQNRDSAQ